MITPTKIATLATELESAYDLLIVAADQLDPMAARELVLHGANLVERVTTELANLARELQPTEQLVGDHHQVDKGNGVEAIYGG